MLEHIIMYQFILLYSCHTEQMNIVDLRQMAVWASIFRCSDLEMKFNEHLFDL